MRHTELFPLRNAISRLWAQKMKKQRSPYAEPKPQHCYKCGKPRLHWRIDGNVPLCHDCRRSGLSRY